MLRVTPYPLFVERVSARRGANDFAAPVAPLNEKKIWDALGRIALSDRNYRLNRVRGEPIVKDAVALWKSRSLGASYDRRLVAVAEHVVYRASVGESDASLVQIVAKEHGVAEMIAMKLLSACIVERGNALAIDDPELRAQELHPFDESWKLARAIASRADDAEYVAAREVASAWRKSHPGYAHRIAADYFFPEENAWAREDLGTVNRATSASPQDFGYAMMPVAATVGDAALVLAFVARLLPYQVPQLAAFSCDFASTLSPADAMNVLCKLLEGSKGATQSSQKEIGIAMCALEGEEMAREPRRASLANADRSDGRRLFSSISGRREDRAREGHARHEQSSGSRANDPRGERAEGRLAARRRERDPERAPRRAVAREEKRSLWCSRRRRRCRQKRSRGPTESASANVTCVATRTCGACTT